MSLDEDRLLAGVDMLRRCGAQQVQIRYSDDDKPIVWFVVGLFDQGRWEVAAGRNPIMALERLLEQLIDGGVCVHCKRPSGFTPDWDAMPLEDHVCWTKWDPEMKTYRRSCP